MIRVSVQRGLGWMVFCDGWGGGGGTDGPMGSRSQQADRAPSSNDGHFMLN